MIIYNTWGLAGVIVCCLLSFLVSTTMQEAGGELTAQDFCVVWSLLTACFALAFDRLPEETTFRPYFEFLQFPLGPARPCRITLCGVPLLAAPLAFSIGGYVIPRLHGDPIPTHSYFLWTSAGGVIAVLLLWLTRDLRRMPMMNPADGNNPPTTFGA